MRVSCQQRPLAVALGTDSSRENGEVGGVPRREEGGPGGATAPGSPSPPVVSPHPVSPHPGTRLKK